MFSPSLFSMSSSPPSSTTPPQNSDPQSGNSDSAAQAGVDATAPAASKEPPVKKQKRNWAAGSFEYDVEKAKFSHRWESLTEFQAWLRKEEQKHGIEFSIKQRVPAPNDLYEQTVYYVCARQGSGGKSKYVKKNPEWTRKVPAKRTGCSAKVTIKTYLTTKAVLGNYMDEHDHGVGDANLRFTRISRDTRVRIAEMLRMKVDTTHIVRPSSTDSPYPEIQLTFVIAA